MCVQFDALKTLFVDAKGFDFVEEGLKKKKGFVGLHPGGEGGQLVPLPPYLPATAATRASFIMRPELC